MSLLNPSLFYFWLLPLASLPILIHLINLFRHRRVQWAAMTFLLESQKRNRNWVRIKQLLLLLARVLAIAAIVFMLAGPILADQWSKLFGGGKAHHVVLLDDSGSMAERWESTSAFTRAKQVVRRLAQRAAKGTDGHRFSLVRFSEAERGGTATLVRALVTQEFAVRLEGPLSKLSSSPLTLNPIAAIAAVGRAIKTEADEKLIVYIVSDFRAAQWEDAAAVREALLELKDAEANVQLVQCSPHDASNLAVTALEPAAGVRATGVELRMEIEVANYGTETARDVRVAVESRSYDDTASDEATADDNPADVLPVVRFDEIGPGKRARTVFPIVFPTAGDQAVTARLPPDALEADGSRFEVLQIAADVRVLILDGGVGIDDSDFLKFSLQPSARVRTGRQVQVERLEYLRDHGLEDFQTVYLLNIERLDPLHVEALEAFVRDGGGVIFFASDATRSSFVNEQLYRNGEGMFPLPLASPAALYFDPEEGTPDVAVDPEHPMFRRIAADEMSTKVFNLVMVERYYAAGRGWTPSPEEGTHVVARLRNGEPLIVEKRFGKGVFLAVLTTSSPYQDNVGWNNWGRNPTFAPVMLDTQTYVGAAKLRDTTRQVGEPLAIPLSVEDYQAEVEFAHLESRPLRTVKREATLDKDSSADMTATLEGTLAAGIYEARLTRANGESEVRRYALNVPGGESDLRRVAPEQLKNLLAGIDHEYYEADRLIVAPVAEAGFKLGDYWLYFVLLALLLVGEQILAYSASYHPSWIGGRRR
ncbi:MAG: hypothetical protein DWQ31_19755 [Planctomycetota bacterium]|nr:MAG: hypothetical protein DWQ31_19755 [Planctomycetota bacterium]